MEMKLTKDNFNLMTLNGKALVDFWAPWCGPCRMIAPVVEEIAEELDGKVLVGKVNVDEEMDLAVRFGVQSIPTLIVMENGKETKRVIGVQSKQELLDMLK